MRYSLPAAFEGYIGDLKGGKTDLHDGGLRVPMIARWPGKIPAGKETDAFAHSNDLLPTFCEAAGVKPSADLPLDGRSLLPHLTGGAALSMDERGTVFWQLDLYKSIQRHYPKPKPYATEVVRRGKWKLLALSGKPVELFDILADPNERTSVLGQHADIAVSMAQELAAWLAEERVRD